MQFKNLAIVSAFAATALAQSVDTISILQVLQTALPSSLVQEALTNQGAVSSQIASQFAAGATPSWYSALPSDVQSYLVPPMVTGVVGSNSTSNNTGTIIPSNSTSNGTASTTSTRTRAIITSDSSETTTRGSGSSGSQTTGAGSEGSSSASESGNAAPTAFIGAGLAGAVGIVGLLAL